VSEQDVAVAVLIEQFKNIREKIEELHEEVERMQADISGIKQMADRWRGATFLVLAVGSVLGWFISAWGNFSKVIR
jgi:uncharacterized protein (UPF0335 family)